MQKIINYIFLSIILSSCFYFYFTVTSFFVFRVLALGFLAAFYVLLVIYFNQTKRRKTIRNVSFTLVNIYLLMVVIIFFTSMKFTQIDLITLFFHPLAFSAYVLGVVALLVNKNSVEFLITISWKISNILPIITIFDIVIFQSPILLPGCYTFLFFDFLFSNNFKRKLYLICCILGSIVLFALYDYRSGIIISGLFLFTIVGSKLFKIINLRFLRILFLIASVTAVNLVFFNFTEFYEYALSFGTSKSVSTTDTRSFLFIEFFDDVKGFDLYFGRGYLGTYFSPYFKEWEGEGGDFFNRFGVEVGFLQIILKGGVLLLLSMVSVFIVGIYKGFVRYKYNSIQFMLSFWLLIEFAMLTIENIPAFSVHFFLIWIVIGILLSNSTKKTSKKLKIYQFNEKLS